MSLLQNAIDSIETGVEDFQQKSPRRIASAVRNFYAGVLLLLKEVLKRYSPPNSNDAFIWERIVFARAEDGGISFRGEGKKTVDVGSILERFAQLGLDIDRARIERLQRIRNNVEHHSASEAPGEIQEAIAKTFVLVTRIIEDHLEASAAHLLPAEVWKTMLAEAETFEAQERRCVESLGLLEDVPEAAKGLLEQIQCTECGSALLEANTSDTCTYGYDTSFVCRGCGEGLTLATVMTDAIDRVHAGEFYDAITGGGDGPFGRCPTCDEETFDVRGDVCVVCCKGRPFTKCEQCGTSLSLLESDDRLCAGCRHTLEKANDD